MSGTLAVVTVYRGHECMSAGYDSAEAADIAAAVAELGGWDSGPDIRDLLPGLQEQFPEGRRVLLGSRAHWRPGYAGTVAAGQPESYARWPQSGPSPWALSSDSAEVFVILDDGYASWWRASWLVPL